MKKRVKQIIVEGGGLALIVIILSIGYILCNKIIAHEKLQQERISNVENLLEIQIHKNDSQQEMLSELNEKVILLQEKSTKNTVVWNSDDFNYLAVGNSITIHGLNEYWWNECGMAATIEDNDYVHRVASALGAKQFAYNFAIWEMMSHDRGEALSLLDGLLSNELDLVTIQLSENATDLTTFESDFRELITYVQDRAQVARIIVIGDFWDKDLNKDNMKQKVCEETGVQFVSLEEIKGKEEYQCGLGTTVYDIEKKPHIVEHSGVAGHPSDIGMEWIAERIIQQLS